MEVTVETGFPLRRESSGRDPRVPLAVLLLRGECVLRVYRKSGFHYDESPLFCPYTEMFSGGPVGYAETFGDLEFYRKEKW